MLVTATNPLTMILSRSGGTIITARLDVWTATSTAWKLEASAVFQQVADTQESQVLTLNKGMYTAVLTAFVSESINGIYGFKFDVNGAVIGKGSGDVNTTSNPHDSAAFKTQYTFDIR